MKKLSKPMKDQKNVQLYAIDPYATHTGCKRDYEAYKYCDYDGCWGPVFEN